MILVEKITIEEFRGIRKLTLDFKSKNFAVCGPNGTGKSGVVDALEFGLTGNISRLSGKGTGGITLANHAPHVDSRNNPEKARVILTIRIPSLNNKQATIERSVKDALTPKITPNSSDVLAILKQIEDCPEFVLSRRELIRYVISPPGDRSEEVQALLRLDQVGELRSTLKTISNTCRRQAEDYKNVLIQARDNLAKSLEISELNTEKLLVATNIRRAILLLDPLEILTSTTSLCDGLETGASAVYSSKINKLRALTELKEANELLQNLCTLVKGTEYRDLQAQMAALSKDPVILDCVLREKFLRTAIDLIVGNLCPVCDTEWDIPKLRDIVQKKLKKFDEVSKTRTALEERLKPIINLIGRLDSAVESLEKYVKDIAKEQIPTLSNYRSKLSGIIKHLKNFVPIVDAISSLNNLIVIATELSTVIDSIKKPFAIIPEPTQQDAARDFLVRCQDRLEIYREAARNSKKAEEHSMNAKNIYDTYVNESTQVLEGVYKKVEEEFGALYRFINSDDEGNFTAHLTPSIGKLGFDVDFYGRGHFPPGAYHSEGHQDGMGLCLYLALMQRLQGDKFMLAVLDDVLMSVDTGHRRDVCKLLKEYFPNTQFILTTHDEVWLKHMVTAGLIMPTSFVKFSNWTPDHGPTEWNNRDIWAEIDVALQNDDVHKAASVLRYYLEYVFKEICHNLRASVEFRGDGRYELGDILAPAVRKLRDVLLNGKNVAESWGKTAEADTINIQEKNLANSFLTSQADQWQINPAIHYNEWANLTADDFIHVVSAFRGLVKHFYCEDKECNSLLYLTNAASKIPDTLRCQCGKANINLKRK